MVRVSPRGSARLGLNTLDRPKRIYTEKNNVIQRSRIRGQSFEAEVATLYLALTLQMPHNSLEILHTFVFGSRFP